LISLPQGIEVMVNEQGADQGRDSARGQQTGRRRRSIYVRGRPANIRSCWRARSTRGQLFDGLLDDELIIHRSATPLLEACRALRERGIDPAAPIVMRYAGSDCDALRTTVGHAAGLTVSDRKGPPTFEPWRASPRSAGSLPTRQIEPAATLVPEALIVRLHGRGALTCHI
jgi:hypothetical protein